MTYEEDRLDFGFVKVHLSVYFSYWRRGNLFAPEAAHGLDRNEITAKMCHRIFPIFGVRANKTRLYTGSSLNQIILCVSVCGLHSSHWCHFYSRPRYRLCGENASDGSVWTNMHRTSAARTRCWRRGRPVSQEERSYGDAPSSPSLDKGLRLEASRYFEGKRGELQGGKI